jgi:hypothetical protein
MEVDSTNLYTAFVQFLLGKITWEQFYQVLGDLRGRTQKPEIFNRSGSEGYNIGRERR